jgi:hypothetical protein
MFHSNKNKKNRRPNRNRSRRDGGATLDSTAPRYARTREIVPKYFRRTTSLSQFGYRLELQNSATTSLPVFNYTGPGTFTNSPDIAFTFSLSYTNLYVGGVLAASVPNPGASEFTALFDEYQIESVELIFTLSSNFAQATSASAQLPLIIGAADYDDTLDTTYSTLQQYNSSHQWRVDKPYSIRVVPRLQIPSYVLGGAVGTATPAMAAPNKMWVDTSATSGALAQHYGFKAALNTYNIPTGLFYFGDLDVQFVYHLSLRDSR